MERRIRHRAYRLWQQDRQRGIDRGADYYWHLAEQQLAGQPPRVHVVRVVATAA